MCLSQVPVQRAPSGPKIPSPQTRGEGRKGMELDSTSVHLELGTSQPMAR
jgi:hypothetical protein